MWTGGAEWPHVGSEEPKCAQADEHEHTHSFEKNLLQRGWRMSFLTGGRDAKKSSEERDRECKAGFFGCNPPCLPMSQDRYVRHRVPSASKKTVDGAHNEAVRRGDSKG